MPSVSVTVEPSAPTHAGPSPPSPSAPWHAEHPCGARPAPARAAAASDTAPPAAGAVVAARRRAAARTRQAEPEHQRTARRRRSMGASLAAAARHPPSRRCDDVAGTRPPPGRPARHHAVSAAAVRRRRIERRTPPSRRAPQRLDVAGAEGGHGGRRAAPAGHGSSASQRGPRRTARADSPVPAARCQAHRLATGDVSTAATAHGSTPVAGTGGHRRHARQPARRRRRRRPRSTRVWLATSTLGTSSRRPSAASPG